MALATKLVIIVEWVITIELVIIFDCCVKCKMSITSEQNYISKSHKINTCTFIFKKAQIAVRSENQLKNSYNPVSLLKNIFRRSLQEIFSCIQTL